jgi:hypothetical protein
LSNEKLFLQQETHNQQNDRVYSVSLRDISREKLAVERYQFVAIIMVVKLAENVPDILTLQDKPARLRI